MKYTPEEAAKLLAGRVNQPHFIEAIIRKCIEESKPKEGDHICALNRAFGHDECLICGKQV